MTDTLKTYPAVAPFPAWVVSAQIAHGIGSSRNYDMLSAIMREENAHAAPRSKVIIAAEEGKADTDALQAPDEPRNIEVDIRPCNIYKRSMLEKLVAEGPSSSTPQSKAATKFSDNDDLIVVAKN